MSTGDMRIEAGDFAVSLMPVAIGVLVVLLMVLWRRKRSLSYLFCCFVFGLYLVLAIDKVFFPIRVNVGEPYSATRFIAGINLIPFNFDLSFIPHIVVMQIVQNVLLTIPFGFGVNFVARVSTRSVLRLAPAVGLGTEVIQLIIGVLLGYPYRVIDINDAMLNALGVLIGYGLFRGFARLYVWTTKQLGVKHQGLSGYVYEVAVRARGMERQLTLKGDIDRLSGSGAVVERQTRKS